MRALATAATAAIVSTELATAKLVSLAKRALRKLAPATAPTRVIASVDNACAIPNTQGGTALFSSARTRAPALVPVLI